MMNSLKAKQFKSISIKSKAELIRAIDNYVFDLENMDEFHTVEAARKRALVDLMNSFKELIDASELVFLDKTFARYEITITDVDIVLDIASYTELEFGDDGYIDNSTSIVTPEIISVRAPYLPLSEFAFQRGVTESMVSEWVQTGALKNVEKRGACWFAAATQEIFKNEAISGVFICNRDKGDLSDIAPVSPGAVYYEVNEYDSPSGEIKIIELDDHERIIAKKVISKSLYLQIEQDFLAATDVIFVNTFVDGITEKSPLRIGNNSATPVTMKQVKCALGYMKIKPETVIVLNAIIDSVQSEELLLEALKVLGIEEELTEKLREMQ